MFPRHFLLALQKISQVNFVVVIQYVDVILFTVSVQNCSLFLKFPSVRKATLISGDNILFKFHTKKHDSFDFTRNSTNCFGGQCKPNRHVLCRLYRPTDHSTCHLRMFPCPTDRNNIVLEGPRLPLKSVEFNFATLFTGHFQITEADPK